MPTFTEYKYEPEFIAAEVERYRAGIKAKLGDDADLLKNAISVIAKRLKKDPMSYRDYGVYWWSVKAILRGAGFNYGSNDDAIMRDFYRGRSLVETIVMAETFRDDYLKTFFRYTNQFILDANSPEIIEIVDGDMERAQ